uniref:CCHC-type domain-containing protein n=1 Tax=Aquila chrysaetos chrysaetos TaxID=223781 RepID=A0A663FJG5_AQUCH
MSNQKCYCCGQAGHVKAKCPAKHRKGGAGQVAVGATTCLKCGKLGHFAKQCKSKFHANG